MVRQLSAAVRGRRALVIGGLGAVPVLLAVLLRSTDPAVLVRIVAICHLLLLLPIVAITLGSGLLYDEAEEGTLVYLWVSPIPRGVEVLGKWAAALALGWGVLLLSLTATVLVTPAAEGGTAWEVPAFVRAAYLAVGLGYPAYLGLFLLVGVLWRHGFVTGLLYSFAYEFVVARIPAAFKLLSLRYFVDSLLYPVSPERRVFMGEFEGFPAATRGASLAVLLGTALVALALAVFLARHKEFRSRNVQG